MKITLGAVVEGGTSIAYDTGSWRDQRPVVDYQDCKDCGLCQDVCPDSSVYEENGRFLIDYAHCKGCGLCAFECPTHCIEMKQEKR